MQRFQSEVEKTGATPVWMILPPHDVLEKQHSRFEPIEVLSMQRCEALKMLCLRLGPHMIEYSKRHPTESLFRPRAVGSHFTPLGQSVMAQLLFEFLTTHELLK